ncbi:hypothetical protein OS493_020444 [Desmophyllum pertusum]|uniref:Uncharacterized protein n=1 Tax=Desmophyllum pertusum TaxID=174260 RepID=A0A9W9ZCC2_9CNID|nr:hypothetical protein OS493_020444 [Desmophyllum pertusum]
MELTLKIMSLVPLIFLLSGFPLSSGRIFLPAKPLSVLTPRSNTTSKSFWINRVTRPRPTPSAPSINEKECSRIVDKLPQSRFYYKFRQVRQLCVRLNESQLLKKMKNLDGLNQRYMAKNRKDACKFKDLSGDGQPMPQAKQAQPVGNQMNITENRVNRLNNLLDETERLGDNNERRRKRSSGSIERGCWSRGSIVDGTTLTRLCTECAATTELPPAVFPPFINEVICGDADRRCFGPIGSCAQRVIRFTFLRRTGEYERDDALSQLLGVDVFVEEFEDFEQDIRSCCECRLFSFLASRIG